MRLHCLIPHSHQCSEVGQTTSDISGNEVNVHQLTLLHNPDFNRAWTWGLARFWGTGNTAKDGNYFNDTNI